MIPLVHHVPGKVKEAAKKVLKIYYMTRIRLRKAPFRYIFIDSHMRSGSTLLAHILFSNPDIIGYGETHIRYESEEDFKDLICHVYTSLHTLRMPEVYVIDKILNSGYINESIVRSEKLHKIFLLRRPEATLRSLLHVISDWDSERAATYYMKRLSALADEAKAADDKKRCLYITYEQILYQTDKVFAVMRDFLGLRHALSERYDVTPKMHMGGIGDWLANIKSGRIIRGHTTSPETHMPPEILDHAATAYESCSSVLRRYCRSLEPD